MAAEKGGKKSQSGKIEQQAEQLVRPIIEAAGYKLWDVCFEKEGAMWYLRVLFDSESGIDSDSCEEITRPINELFDKQEFINNVDILEVGTPGLSKKLRKPEHFKECIGEKIRAVVRDEKGKEIGIFGILSEYDEAEGAITLDSDDKKTVLKLSECIKINADL